MTEQFVHNYHFTQDGTRIFYSTNFHAIKDKEKKPLLVFVYGLVCNNAHWKYQVKYFSDLEYPILLHDFRGHFNSSGAESIESVTFSNISNDLSELLKKIEFDHIVFLGHSMGVNVALEFATQYPELVQGMVLLSGAVVPPQDLMFGSNLSDITFPLLQYLRDNFPEILSTIWKHGKDMPLLDHFIRVAGFNQNTVDIEFVREYLLKMSELPVELFLKLLEEMESHNVITKLPIIKTKTLLMGGDKDLLIPNTSQYLIKKLLPQAELYIVKNGSHVPQVDFPDYINERIKLFVDNL